MCPLWSCICVCMRIVLRRCVHSFRLPCVSINDKILCALEDDLLSSFFLYFPFTHFYFLAPPTPPPRPSQMFVAVRISVFRLGFDLKPSSNKVRGDISSSSSSSYISNKICRNRNGHGQFRSDLFP